MVQFAVTGRAANPMPARLSAWAIYDVFDCADGEQVFVGVVSDTQWRRFCDAFGLDHLRDDPELATNPQRCHARDRFLPEIRALFGAMGHEALMERCAELGLPFAPICKPEDLYDDPHLNASGGLLDVEMPDGAVTKVPGLPLTLNGRRTAVRRPIPSVGAHSVEVAREAGLSAADIAHMVDDGVLGAVMTRSAAE